MAKIKVSKNLIVSLAEQTNKNYIEKTNRKVKQVVGSAVQALSEKVSYITNKNVVLQPVNEYLNGAFVDNSEFVYFLGINNAQLELNTAKKTNFWKEFLSKLKFAWANRNKKKKKEKKKKKKSEEQTKTTLDYEFDPAKYSIYNLAEDLQNALVNCLSETSLIHLKGNLIYIIGKDDFGANTKIKIFVVSYNDEFFRYYAGKRKGYIDVNINERCKILGDKIKQTGENFVKIQKVINSLYFNVNGNIPNQVFVESVLCFVPDELFQDEDIYNVFVKIINFLSIKSLRNVASINDTTKTIFKDPICGNCGLGFMKMLDFVASHDE